MADLVLLCISHFCHGLFAYAENRIIAEAVFPSGRSSDHTLANAGEELLLPCRIHIAQHALEPCSAFFCGSVFQQFQQLFATLGISGIFAGKPVRVYPWCSVQCVYQQSAVICNDGTVQGFVNRMGFQCCILCKGSAGFFYFRIKAGFFLGNCVQPEGGKIARISRSFPALFDAMTIFFIVIPP